MENVKRNKGQGICQCSYCGKEIPPSTKVIYIRTQRRTELYICPGCYRETQGKK